MCGNIFDLLIDTRAGDEKLKDLQTNLEKLEKEKSRLNDEVERLKKKNNVTHDFRVSRFFARVTVPGLFRRI